ncbi:hypothetical protein [Clostridium sp.]|uniref:hypothetical protein n=1 Tax=Clostridium sp. TaxID=1506 RepID=UPI0026714191|nr:hypothetical protein [Clostridium sp.]MCI7031264.1 hypothetical protein [Clostridium sp.]
MYKIMFYGGMAGTIFMLVITVFIFIKGNVLEDIKDLLGIKSTKKTLNKISLNNTTSNIKAVTTNEVSKPMDIKMDEIISKGFACEEGTEILKDYDEDTMILSGEEEETMILGFEEETELLNEFVKEIDIVIVNSNLII